MKLSRREGSSLMALFAVCAPTGAAGSYSSSAGRRVLISKIRQTASDCGGCVIGNRAEIIARIDITRLGRRRVYPWRRFLFQS
jgi:hypothetical protein